MKSTSCDDTKMFLFFKLLLAQQLGSASFEQSGVVSHDERRNKF